MVVKSFVVLSLSDIVRDYIVILCSKVSIIPAGFLQATFLFDEKTHNRECLLYWRVKSLIIEGSIKSGLVTLGRDSLDLLSE